MSQAIQIKGTIQMVGEVKSVGSKGFQKREFVVLTEEKFPQQIIMEMTGDRVSMLDQYRVGDAVTASVNLKGRKWEGPNGVKWFNTIEAWRIEGLGAGRSAGGKHQAPNGGGGQDDIPF